MQRICLVLLALSVTPFVYADPLSGSLELGSSVSQSNDGRNVLVNPAGLAYETELNGAAPLTSFSYGANRNLADEFATSLSWGYLGFGVERLLHPTGKLQRYSMGLGIPFHPMVFGGVRLRLHNVESPLASEPSSLDFGLQFRPSRYFSIGMLANRTNQSGTQYVWGATVRPLPWLEISGDIDNTSNDFWRVASYQVSGGVEILPGAKITLGYHQDYKAQIGFQWNFGYGAIATRYQPGSDTKRLVMGFMASPVPYRSSLRNTPSLRIDLDNSLSEEGYPGNLFAGERPSLASLLKTLDEAEARPPAIVVVRIESFPMGLAAAQEVFEALARLREKGSRIEAFLGNGGIKEYLIASAAHSIHMETSGSLTLLGLKAESYFLKGTLEKLGVEGEFLARGKFKSAPEVFTRTESSETHRQTVKEDLADAQTHLVAMLGKYRGIDAKRWKEILEHALWSAEDAKAGKLIDHVDSFALTLEAIEQDHLLRDSVKVRSTRLALPPRVAVIPLAGDILAGKIPALALTGRGAITPDRVDSLLSRALADSRTKAIVLRVNSGGGEILASELIANLVEKANKRKPIYLSMGDAAASGGYFIAIPARRVFADSLTLTGSIGVFLGKFSLAGTYKWLQLRKEILSDAPYPSLFSEHQPWSAPERAILLRRMNQYYEAFVKYVATKRGLSGAAAENAAQGRVWLGSRALGLKLVDELGGLTQTVKFAARDTGLPDYESWVVSDGGGLFDFSTGVLGQSQAEVVSRLLPSDLSRELFWWSELRQDPFLYLSPMESF